MKNKIAQFVIAIFFVNSLYIVNAQNINWMKSFGGTNYENLNAATIDHYGNIYICGSFKDSIDIAPGEDEYILVSNSGYDTFVQKLNSEGELLHANSIGGINSDYSRVITTDQNLNYYTSGTFKSKIDVDPGPDTLFFTPLGQRNVFFQKFNQTGELLWAFQLKTIWEDDELNDIAIDEDGNVYCIGGFSGTLDFDPGESTFELTSIGEQDIFVQKLNSNGEFLWAKNFGSGYNNYGKRILVDGEENILITGSFKGSVDFDPGPDTFTLNSSGVLDIFFLKLTFDGDLLWAKQIGGGSNEYVKTLQFDHDKNILLGGTFRFQADFNPDPDEEYIVEGGMWSDFFILKLDENGCFKWVKTVGGDNPMHIQSIAVDSINNIYFASNFDTPFDVNPGDSTYIIEPTGDFDFFIAKINADGEFESVIIMGSEYFEYVNTIVLDKKANIYAIGIFKDSPEYFLNSSSASLVSVGQVDVFIEKISQTNTGIFEYPGFNIAVYPNPNSGFFTIRGKKMEPGSYILKVINSIGQCVFEKEVINFGEFEEVIHLEDSGLYLVEISNSHNFKMIRKVIINNL